MNNFTIINISCATSHCDILYLPLLKHVHEVAKPLSLGWHSSNADSLTDNSNNMGQAFCCWADLATCAQCMIKRPHANIHT